MACVCIPNLRLPIEGAGHDFVAVGVVERHCVDDVGVVVEREQLLPRVRIPDLARAIVAPSDELVTAFVKRAICQRQKMGSQHFEKTEALLLILLLLLDQLLDKLLELRFARLGDQWLLKQYLVDQAINVSSIVKFQNQGLGRRIPDFRSSNNNRRFKTMASW